MGNCYWTDNNDTHLEFTASDAGLIFAQKFPTSLSILILFACILPYTTTDFLSWDSCNELYENNTFI